MVSSAVAVAAALLWLLAAFKAAGTIRSGSASARWLLAAIVFLAMGITIFVPAVEQRLADAVPVDQIKEPLARTAVIAAAFCGQTLLSLTGDPISRRARLLRWAFAVLAVAVLWVTFMIGPAAPEAQFGSHPVRDVSMTLFILAFLGYLAYAVTTVMAGCWRYARSATGAMRSGLRLISAGCASCLAYVLVKLVAIVGFWAGVPVAPAVEGAVAQGLVAVGALLVVVGSAATATSQRAADLRDWVRDYVAYRRLYPLWVDLVGVVPAVALDPAAGRWQDASRVRDMHWRLVRRVIELRDAWLALRPYMDADLAEALTAHAPDGDRASPARVESRMLRAAVDALQAHRPAARPWSPPSSQRTSMVEELAWWSAVAAAWEGQRDSNAITGTSENALAR